VLRLGFYKKLEAWKKEIKPPGQLPLSLTDCFEWANQHPDPVWQNLKNTWHSSEWSWVYKFFSFDGFYFYLLCFSGSGSGVIAENKSFPVMPNYQAFKKCAIFQPYIFFSSHAKETKYFFEFSGFYWRIQ